MSKLRKSKELQVHIVEQHNDAVPPIHRAVGSRLLPFSNAAMVHLDSHPDLLIPVHMQANTVFQPEELYDSLSIENWILPLVFAKHFDHIVWVKPPWACQIPVSRQRFLIGRCVQSGCMRVTSKENYFLTDGLFRPASELSDTSVLTLQVEEVLPQAWANLDSSYVTGNSVSELYTQGQNHPSWIQQVQDSVKDKSYVLDIDLDFFSTANPFRDLLETEEEQALRRLYKYTTPTELSDESIASFTEDREEQLNLLEEIFTELENKRLEIEAIQGSADEDIDLSKTNPFAPVLNDARELGLTEEKIQDLGILCKAILQQSLSNLQAASHNSSPSHHSSNVLKSSLDFRACSSDTSESCPQTNSVCSSSSLSPKSQGLSHSKSTKIVSSNNTTQVKISNIGTPETPCERSSSDAVPAESYELSPLIEPTRNASVNKKPSEGLLSTLQTKDQSLDKSSENQSNAEQSQIESDIQIPPESLTFLQLHDFGCTLDDTELPHHLSSQPQVVALMMEVKAMLESLPRPALVTIARSSDDGYCPKEEVGHYERDILKMLQEVFGALNITKHYAS